MDLRLDVSYAEADQTTLISLACGGQEYNPFEQDEAGLGVTILKNMAKQIDYRRENGRNLIEVTL